MRTICVTHSKTHVLKGKMPDPPKGIHREFASAKSSNGSKPKKGKTINCSISGVGRPKDPNHHPSQAIQLPQHLKLHHQQGL